VDAGRLDIPQDELEAMLFALVRKLGYGEKVVDRYRMVMRFHHQRVPLIVLIAGTVRSSVHSMLSHVSSFSELFACFFRQGCIGKSMLATRLAERLNITAVLPTDLVHELMVPISPYVLLS
jgi:2-phosphoglycerate kinase